MVTVIPNPTPAIHHHTSQAPAVFVHHDTLPLSVAQPKALDRSNAHATEARRKRPSLKQVLFTIFVTSIMTLQHFYMSRRRGSAGLVSFMGENRLNSPWRCFNPYDSCHYRLVAIAVSYNTTGNDCLKP